MIKKLLRDYPAQTWMEAADRCEYCKAPYQVKITWVDPEENVGDVVTRITHKEDCPERYDQGIDYDPVEIRDLDIAGWEYMEKPIKLKDLELYPLKARANVGPCHLCGKLIVGVPLILFLDQGRKGELDFCWSCAEERGILKEILEAPK